MEDATATSTVLPTIVAPIVANIDHPILRKLGKTNIRRFLTDRHAYIREIAERSAQDIGTQGRPVSLTFSIDPPLLESLVDLRQFGAHLDTVALVTDDVLNTWLEKHWAIKKDSLSASQVQSIISKSLRINMAEGDREQRIIMLFADYRSLLRLHGMAWLVNDNTKVAVTHIVDALKPSTLSKRVKDDLNFGHAHLNGDFLLFMQHCIVRAEQYAEHEEPASQSHNPTRTPEATTKSTSPGATKTKPISGHTVVGTATKSSKEKSAPDCLNPDCSLKHMLKDCDYTPKLRKDELFAQLAERRKTNGEQRMTRRDTFSASVTSSAPSSTETIAGATGAKAARLGGDTPAGRVMVTLESVLHTIALPDSGADSNVIPRSIIRQLEALGTFVPIRSLQKPVQIQLALHGPGCTAQVTQQAQLTMDLLLVAGPLRLRRCNWLIVEQEMDEVLIGRPLLEALGLNACEHLASVRDEYQNLDCSSISLGPTGGKLTRVLLQQLPEDSGSSPPVSLNVNLTSTPTLSSLSSFATGSPPIAEQLHQNDFSPTSAQKYEPPIITPFEMPLVSLKISGNTDVAEINGKTPRADSVTYGELDIDPVDIPQLLDLPSSIRTAELASSLEAITTTAVSNGLPTENVAALRRLLHDFSDIWSLSLQAGPPAKVLPLVIKLRPDAVPVRTRVRRYSQEKRDFLARFVAELESHGLIYRNPRAAWCSAPLLVFKPGPAKLRFTVDLRPVNSQTVPCSWPMPHVESELARLKGSTCFATFDLSHGYWQLPLDPDSQECQSFITPDGVFTPTRVLHGTTNAVTHMQAVLSEVFSSLNTHILAWLDDLLLHAASPGELLVYLRRFFNLCRNFNIKLHPGKAVLFATTVRWCGRLISSEGVKFDPSRIQGLLDMPPPSSGSDLQQFVCALNWMRMAIPAYTELLSPLHTLLEAVYARSGKRTKVAASRIQLLDVGWSSDHLRVFKSCQTALAHATTLAHPSSAKRLCLYTDASQDFWSAIATQVPPSDLDLPLDQQRHEPLAFLSGGFNGAMSRWPIIEKEAYAIIASCTRLDWLLQCADGFSLFTDHHNLLYIFNPAGTHGVTSAHSAAKLIRWALRLSSYRYTIEHIAGPDNVWSDMLTRWASPTPVAKVSMLMLAPVSPNMDPTFEWPTASEIRLIQDTARVGNIATGSSIFLSADDHLFHLPLGPVWIPGTAHELQLRLCIVAHTGPGGHRGVDSTTASIQNLFHWPTLREDVLTFCNTCLHCRSTIGGHRTPRPLGQALHASSPNEVIHFDYLYMGPSEAGFKYLLLIKDDLSGYVWLVPTQAADAAATVDALTLWFAAFGVVKTWVSDQGSHFKNQVMDSVRKTLRSQHHFTTAYSPWANGTIERACREVLRAVRALLSEFRLSVSQWPTVVRIVQSVLNNSPSQHRGNIAPLTAFTGRSPDSPLQNLVSPVADQALPLNSIRAQQLMNIAELRASIDDIHRQAAQSATSSRASSRAHRGKTTALAANFDVGDFVLVAKREFRGGEKLSLRWRGPYRVVATLSQFVFEVEDLLTKIVTPVHSTRLRFYHDPSLSVTADILAHLAHQTQGYEVDALLDLRYDPEAKAFLIQVSWLGFEATDNTWEPLLTLYEDIPSAVLQFLASSPDRALASRASNTLPKPSSLREGGV
jgi:RNase H-like domain found in reverse transcriptase/Reverse transcriptase (RNA-dependent DNA polymerase)/Integrase core domain/Integrase zinc binding domain